MLDGKVYRIYTKVESEGIKMTKVVTYKEVLESIKNGETKAIFMMPNSVDGFTSSMLRKSIMGNKTIPEMFEDIFIFTENNNREDGIPVFKLDFA